MNSANITKQSSPTQQLLIILNSGTINTLKKQFVSTHISHGLKPQLCLLVFIDIMYMVKKSLSGIGLYTKPNALLFLLFGELKQMVTIWGVGSPHAIGSRIYTKRRKFITKK